MDENNMIAAGVALGVSNMKAFIAGIKDGMEQGEELTSGLSYPDHDSQWEYDTGTKIGACIKVR